MKPYKIVPTIVSLNGVKHNETVFNPTKHEIQDKIKHHSSLCHCSYCIDTCNVVNCEAISDGMYTVSVKELSESQKDKIELVPLSLVINENLTEYVAPKPQQAFNSVSVKVDVPEQLSSFIPTKAIILHENGTEIFLFKKCENAIKGNDAKHNYLILIYSCDDAKNVLEFISMKNNEILKGLRNKYGIMLSFSKEMTPKSIEIFCKSNENENETSLLYIEGNPFHQNMKILLSKKIK